jgi:hypothetical protein
MKVHELIEELQKLDQDKLIVINGYEGGCDFPNHIYQVKINLNVNTDIAWYYGKHEYVMPLDDKYNPDEWNAYVLEAKN